MSRTVRDIEEARASHDADPQPTLADRGRAAAASARLGGRALYVRRTAPVGQPVDRTADEKAQKLSGRALMIARQKNGGSPLGTRRP
jgi:hypothetical protein